jgi:hypothetical protein
MPDTTRRRRSPDWSLRPPELTSEPVPPEFINVTLNETNETNFDPANYPHFTETLPPVAAPEPAPAPPTVMPGYVVCEGCYRERPAGNICSTCNACTRSCCVCWQCNNCLSRHRDTSAQCRSCYQCTSCCHCFHCPGRTRRSTTYGTEAHRAAGDQCPTCSRCSTHCRCLHISDGSLIQFTTGPLTFFDSAERGQRAGFTRNNSKRFVALEIEVAGLHRKAGLVNDVISRWNASIVHDGSLPNTGFEINTSPANGNLLVEQIEEIAAALRGAEAGVTPQCGLHVHVDARDFKFYDLRRLIFLYERIESQLFSMVPMRRRENRYCIPCGNDYALAMRENRMPKATKKRIVELAEGHIATESRILVRNPRTQLEEYAYPGSALFSKHVDRAVKFRMEHAKGSKYGGNRYNALNIHSWLYRGTVECRLHHGTTNRTRLLNWALLWASILDNAMRMSEPEIEALPRTGNDALLLMAPNDEIRTWIEERIEKFGDVD